MRKQAFDKGDKLSQKKKRRKKNRYCFNSQFQLTFKAFVI